MRPTLSSGSTTGETLPLAASVYWRSSPVFRLSVQMLKMLPLRATSGSIGCVGFTAVDGNTSVVPSMNLAWPSSCVPKVSCVFFLVSRS